MRWWQWKNRDEDLARELQSDLELEEEEQQEIGLSAEEARFASRADLSAHPWRCGPRPKKSQATCRACLAPRTLCRVRRRPCNAP